MSEKMAITCVLLLYFTALSTSASTMDNNMKLVIIGAGASGYAAGCRLLENNFTDFVILEAQDRIGGRVHSVPFGRDKIDMGGQWIHGEVGNIINEMATKYDLVYKSSGVSRNAITYQSDGKKFDLEVFHNLASFLAKVGDEDTTNVTTSSGEYITKRFWEVMDPEIKQQKITRVEAEGLLRLAEFMDNSMEASPSWFETSAQGAYENYEGEFNVAWKFGGYSTVFDLLSKKIPNPNKQLKIDERVRLGKEVTLVDWSGDRVLVRCADGSEFNADRVLTTVSLNVLKATASSIFKPALPDQHTKAIRGLGMGTVDKVYLEFPYRWWDVGTDGLTLSWRQEDIEKVPEDLKWTTGLFGFTMVDNFPLNLLCGWMNGARAEAMEAVPEDVVKDEVMKLLRRFVGPQVPDPVSIRRSRWFSNPFTRGSYSHRSVTSDALGVWPNDLAQAISNSVGKTVLHFAGEATNQLHYSTVHGAVESGFREADKILSYN